MRKTFSWICMVVFVLGISTGWTQVIATENTVPAKAVPAVLQASCIVKITADPAVFPLSIDNITYLVYSSGVGGKAIHELLGDEGPNPEDVIEVEELYGSDSKRSGGYGMGGYGGRGGYGDEMYGGDMKTLPAMYEAGIVLQTESMPAYGGGTSRTMTTTSRKPAATRPTATRTTTAVTPTTSRTTSSKRSSSSPTTPTSSSSTSRYSAFTRATAQPSTDQTSFFFRLIVELDEEPVAQELLLTVVTNLRRVLEDAYDEHMSIVRQRIDLADMEVDHAEAELVELQAMLRDLSGARDLSQRAILNDVRQLRDQLENAKMEQASNEAMVDVTQKRMAQSRNMLEEKLANDVIRRELERIVEINLKKLKYSEQLFVSGTASASEVDKASEALARAKIELAKRTEDLSRTVSGYQEASLNSELADISVTMTQNATHIAMLEPQLAESESLLEKADRYEVESLKLDLAKRNMEEVILWRDQMSRKVRRLEAPIVIVMGAD